MYQNEATGFHFMVANHSPASSCTWGMGETLISEKESEWLENESFLWRGKPV